MVCLQQVLQTFGILQTKGYETPTLPKNLLKLENRLSVILMKFIGSMSLLLIYMNDYFHFHLLQTHY